MEWHCCALDCDLNKRNIIAIVFYSSIPETIDLITHYHTHIGPLVAGLALATCALLPIVIVLVLKAFVSSIAVL